jgi:pimeloyl-ACP methyl ester carboxylesterase
MVRTFPVALAAIVLLASCGGDGGGDRRAGVVNVTLEERSYGRGADQVWVIQPTGADVRSVVVFIHGHGGPLEDTPHFHRPWLRHLARRGNAVIYPRYEAYPGGHGTVPHIKRAVETAMQEIDGDDAPIIGIGYSRGGRLVMDWAAVAAGSEHEPEALLSVFPASGEDPEEDLSSIPPSTRIVVQVGDSDEVVGSLGAIALMEQLTVPGIPDPSRTVEIVHSRDGFKASHLSVLETTPGARAAFWLRADRLIAATRAD